VYRVGINKGRKVWFECVCEDLGWIQTARFGVLLTQYVWPCFHNRRIIFCPAEQISDFFWSNYESNQQEAFFFLFIAVALRPNAGHGHLFLDVSRSHTQRRITVGRIPLDE